LKLDEEILIIDLLYALLLPSGNDAGVALAQFFGKFLSYKFARENDTNDKTKTSMDKFKEFK
jgi:D-alanyl-D-alanine carboxypeptidase